MRGAPENTVLAFERALQAGADGFELDVRVCKSGEVVVMHDADLKRMAGREGEIAALDYAELCEVDLGDGQHVPLLRDALQLGLSRNARVNVEIKSDVPNLDQLVRGSVAEILALPTPQQELVVVSSFDASALQQVRALAPTLALGFLYANEQQEATQPGLPGSGEHPRFSYVSEESLQRFRARASFINVWTVNDPEEARRLCALGVDGLISDVPDTILAALRSTPV